MGKFTYLPHTADIRMEVDAGSLEDLFLTSMRGMARILADSDAIPTGPEGSIRHKIEITSLDTTALLIDFLSDVLTAGYEYHAVFRDIDQVTLDDCSVKATVSGYRIKRFDEDIKAVTYHEAQVVQTSDGGWHTVVIFDI